MLLKDVLSWIKEKDIFVKVHYSNEVEDNLLKLHTLSLKQKERLITAVYLGAAFIIVAVVYYINLANSILNRVVDFFSSLTLATVPNVGIPLPAPVHPAFHVLLYGAALELCLGLGILEISVLAIRILMHSSMLRKAETIEHLVFWFGTSYLISSYLLSMTIMSEWFVFWSGVILIAGFSLVARSFILLMSRRL